MPGTIVCGVDESAEVSGALPVARSLSKRLDCRLLLVSVAHVPLVPGVSGVPYGHDALRADAVHDAERLLRRVRSEHGLGLAETRVVVGDPVQALCSVAKDEGADLLVVGTRGHGPFRAAMVGSVSRGVVLRAPCPVVVVPRGTMAPRLVSDLVPAEAPDARTQARAS